jgi:MerR family transcriptional regulator, light-induced transcriptional regulator
VNDSADTPSEPLYSMRVAARMTGLTPDTIRVWERRYEAVSPVRTGGNARRYRAADVRRLQLLQRASELGHRIHEIARLPETELEALLACSGGQPSTPGPLSDSSGQASFHALREEYLDAIGRFEAQHAARLLHRAAVLLSRDDFLFEVVLPILRTVGDRWEAGKLGVAQEHLVSMQVRSLLQTDLRASGVAPGAPRIVIATPPDELHEFGALMGALLAASRGFEPIYLGPNLPWAEIVLAAEKSGAAIVLLGMLREPGPDEQSGHQVGLEALVNSGAEVWLGLPPVRVARTSARGPRYFSSFEELDVALLDAATRG